MFKNNHLKSLHPYRLILISLMIALAVVVASLGLARQQQRASAAAGGIIVENLAGPLTPQDLVNQLVGSGITVTNVTYTGSVFAAGQFSGGTGIIGFEEGIILSSGSISNVVGPNTDDGITWVNGTPGDADLTSLAGFDTLDAAVLEFDFIPTEPGLMFRYVFSSDEYNEFVNSQFNDVFAFYVNGVNCAIVGGDPVSINTINNGNPFGTDPRSNSSQYINNDLDDGGGTINTEMDGLTVILGCNASVNPGSLNHIKLAIADTSDNFLDTNVFLESGSFISLLPPQSYLPFISRNP